MDNFIEVSNFTIAVKNGNLELVKYFVEEKFNTIEHITITLQIAAGEGQLEVVKYLLKRGAIIDQYDYYPDVDNPNKCLHTAFLRSVQNGHLEVAKYLAQEQIAKNETDECDSILNQIPEALKLAIYGNYLEILKHIIDDLEIISDSFLDREILYYISISVRSGHLEIVKYLFSKINSKKHLNVILLDALYSSRLEIVKWAIDSGADIKIDHEDDLIARALRYSIGCGHLEIVKYIVHRMIEAQQNVIIFDGDNIHPLVKDIFEKIHPNKFA